ncbi:MAG TPA: hypothetical protein PKO25_04990 [Spirochaetota bacterium]|jgi:hypothetical protein|nr:hypothetical protein [Spirochaetota bacterium]OPZ38283.1 MAG: hypothetical protein BWY96_01107 [Spirochaetes bacterium ADurb.BinA120]HNU91205.1 hypothetical protein [Spirochaetota bacterium]HPI14090.1 hypothetical protein [Spirochaetota bacterium]HPO45700.1 hypothetical protein [Spirochaetota bacterium]
MGPPEKTNFYVEPVEIEIYLKKSGKVRTIIKDMYVELIEVEPHNEHSVRIFQHFREIESPIDLIEIMNIFPEYIKPIYESYYQHMDLFEKLSMHIQSAAGGSIDSLRLSLYFIELLIKYEPTVAAIDYIGDFQTYNLNHLIRKLNTLNESFLLEDSTVAYLIKRRNKAWEGRTRDREFDKLVELWQYNIKEKLL